MNADPTVFIVDDDDAVLKQLSFTAKSVGLETSTFASAEEFLADYEPARPGCLVLDVRLSGMSGSSFSRS